MLVRVVNACRCPVVATFVNVRYMTDKIAMMKTCVYVGNRITGPHDDVLPRAESSILVKLMSSNEHGLTLK